MKKLLSGSALRRHLVAGLIVIAPLTATLYVLWWIFGILDGLLGRFLYPALGRPIPGLGLLLLFLVLVLVGWLAERAIGSRVIAWWDGLLDRIPVLRRIYGATSRIVRTVLGDDTRPFGAVVLLEYPSPGRWSIGFLSARAPDVVQPHADDSVSVFVPTTPNPTSGYLVIVPRANLVFVDMTVDEAFTYILSAGSVRPAVKEGVGPRAGSAGGLNVLAVPPETSSSGTAS